MSVIAESPSTPQTKEREEILLELKNIRDLPTLPAVFVRVIRALRNPNASVKDISRVVEADQAIAMKILRLINSSFYGLSRSVDSVHQAIVLLGSNTLKNVVISASVFKALGGGGQDKAFNRESFWQHSIGCGMIARCLGNHVGCCQDEEGFIAGIIHDIGKVVLDQYFHEKFVKVLNHSRQNGVSFYQAEGEVLGTNHSEIGAFLAETWSLPDKLVNVIAHHHHFEAGTEHASIVALVQVSDMLARQYKVGFGGDDQVPLLDAVIWEQLHLTPEQIGEWDEEIQVEIAKGRELLEMMLN
jgi:putative nucleotidyltransferase with HDIG domain